MAFQTLRGTFDILPDAQEAGGSFIPGSAAWRHAEAVVRGVMAQFGFEEIRTPMMEPLGLIARGVGATTDIVQKEMFVVPRGDEEYVLRPEVTAPVMRAFLQHRLDQRGGAQRLYYIGPCFRAERPQKGRFRQFHQFGVELLGSGEPVADAEAIACLRAVYEAFGITETRLRINSLGDAEARPRYKEALQAYFEPFRDRLSATSRQRLDTNPLRILDTKSEDERALLAEAPRLSAYLGEAAQAHFDMVKGYLDALGIPYVEDPLLVRGLDYYTGVVFELESDALGAQSALAAGGRYDGLAAAVGGKQPVPAVGWAAGIERLFLALQDTGYAFPASARPDAFLVALGDEAQTWAFAEAQRLRAAGLQVVFDLQGRSMKAQMKEANRQQTRLALIVGSDELAAGTATVRDLDSSEQRTVPFNELIDALRANAEPSGV
ncbi:MAG: histidine--tRNA ligase [Rhodothermaceae bacterium]|nr:histidine--tRNA ligase [Rhodothermaceae bacterium]